MNKIHFVLDALLLFIILGLPIWVNRIFDFKADASALAVIVPAWGIFVIALLKTKNIL